MIFAFKPGNLITHSSCNGGHMTEKNNSIKYKSFSDLNRTEASLLDFSKMATNLTNIKLKTK
jgi:hypothetical protein